MARIPTALAAALGLASILTLPVHALERSEPLWNYPVDGKLTVFKVTILGDVVIGTDAGLACLDGATGAAKWKLPGAAFYTDGVNRTKGGVFAMVAWKDSAHSVDYPTGTKLWSMWSQVPGDARGLHTLTPLGLVVACAKHGGLVGVAGLDLDTGDLRWRQDSLFVAFPESKDGREIDFLTPPQNLMVAADSTAYWWPPLGGPIRFDLRTGALLWRSDDAVRAFSKPPRFEDPEWDEENGMILAASRRQVVAIRESDGSVAWKKDGKYPCDIASVRATKDRVILMAGEKPFYDILDISTGASLLPEPRKAKGLSAVRVSDGSLYYVADGALRAVDLQTGSERDVAKVKFKGGYVVNQIEVREDGYVLQSRQNIAVLDRSGAIQFERDYEAAPGNFWADLASVMVGYPAPVGPRTNPELEAAKTMRGGATSPELANRLAALLEAKDCAYFYTGQSDKTGHYEFSLVRVDRTNGEELGRVWIDQRDPLYRIDHATGTVFIKSGKAIAAYRF